VCLRWISILIGVVACIPMNAHALPKQSGTHPCGCLCEVVLGDGTRASVPANFQLPSQYICGEANNTVCNVSDPTTGSVVQGTHQGCNIGYLTSSTHTIPLGTFHAPLKGINAPPNR
jgi:hypothetical protein